MRKLARLAIAGLLVSSANPAAATRATPGTQAAYDVRVDIEARDCAAATARLSEGLAKNYPEVNLIAGAMFEHGVCVKADWDRAVRFYSKAFDGGQKSAMYRLMSGFAAPEHGPDMAAAMWWANRPNDEFKLNGCKVSEANRNDPDRFVEELRTWPRLAMCNYMVGVLATMAGEMRYPEKAQKFSVGGNVMLRFQPAVPRIDIKTAETREYQVLGWLNDNALSARQSRSVKGTFEAAMREAADRALKRYPQPAGFAPDFVAEIEFIFQFED
jgi:hypothetical protein